MVNEIHVHHFKQFNGSPAQPLYPRIILELQHKGFINNRSVGIDWDNEVLVAVDSTGKTIGFIAYKLHQWVNEYYIALSWVDPDYTRQGVFTELFSQLVNRARLNKVCSIESHTHPKNTPARNAFEKQGRVVTSIGYSFQIREFSEGVPPEDWKSLTEN